MIDRIYTITRDALIVLIVCTVGFIAGAIVHADPAHAGEGNEPTCMTTVGEPQTWVGDLRFDHKRRLFVRNTLVIEQEETHCVYPDGTETSSAVITDEYVTTREVVREECSSEDQQTPCVWDARHMGNGKGSSFRVSKEGFWIKVSHLRAHRLLGYARYGCDTCR